MISIILPALRPTLAQAALESIERASQGIDYEVVLVAPFSMPGERIVHVREEVPGGVCAAQAAGYAASRGDLVVAFSEDHLALKHWLKPLEPWIAEREKRHFPFSGGLSRPDNPWFGTVYGLYYPYFPVMSRRSIEAIGGWFSTDFAGHFGDPDLALRVWKNGGRCEVIYEAHIRSNVKEDSSTESIHKKTMREKDLSTFIGKYHGEFGAGFREELTDINTNYLINELEDRTFQKRLPQRIYEPRPEMESFLRDRHYRPEKKKKRVLLPRIQVHWVKNEE